VFDGVPITRALIALPAIWLVQGLLTFAVSVFIAAVSVLARDVQHLIGVVLLFWFYLTPIFYDLAQVPRELASWFSWNPLVPIVAAHRAVTLYGRFPDWIQLGYWALAAVAFVAVSLVVFRSLEDMFVEEA
jgi:ABC-type polysaccharide/polyol phosphate export permease